MIKIKLRKLDPYRPKEFARKAQEQFVQTNEAIQKWAMLSMPLCWTFYKNNRVVCRRDKHLLRELTTENASEVCVYVTLQESH